jgi:hypothetical protein
MDILFVLLYLAAVFLFVLGVLKLVAREWVLGIVLIVLSFLVGPAGTNLFGL